ncbi:AbgT family transporter [uncultured Cetobacterium sp.]|uniref:AbgT family transporter n=1 Tax=uncultured Cetobacterium sp. TaxID=527638 RepID=UPI00262761EF|nr:AbgT family transporter [uncultured Cetobacterium sp.]
MSNANIGILSKTIKVVETTGNKLPHPFILFGIFSIITLFISFSLNKLGFGVTYFESSKIAGEVGKNVTLIVENLLTTKNMRILIQDIPNIYVNFPSLKIVILMMMAIGLVEKTGFFTALMRKYLLNAPKSIVTGALIFTAVNANIMSDAGTIFAFTIGGVLFAALGRNPKIGIIAGFAACSGGFTANMFVAGTDALLAGITEQAAAAVGVNLTINPLCNYYFMLAATFVLTITLTIFTEKVVVKTVGDTDLGNNAELLKSYKLTSNEEKGLKFSFYGFLGFLIIFFLLCYPENAFFRNDLGGFLPKSPLLSSIVPIIFVMFTVIGTSYGIGVGKIKTTRDIPKLLQAGLTQAVPLMVTLLSSSIFIYLLNKSNIFKIFAVKGSFILKDANVGPLPLLLLVVLITTMINPMMTSGSTKWILLAPMVVPMFSLLNISPAYAQLAFRIGDSSTNIISPLHSSIPVILGLLAQYEAEGKIPHTKGDGEAGFGTIFALTLPYSIVILVSLVSLMIVWYFLGLPIGPGFNLAL